MRAIDTNVLVRLIIRDDPRQAAAADALIENGAWVSILALAEAIWVFTSVYQRTASHLVSAIEMLLDHKTLTLQDSDVVSAALDLFKSKPSIEFSDCLMLHLAQKEGHMPLGTFDRLLARAQGTQKL